MEAAGLVKGGGGLPGQTDDRQAVGTVGGDLKLHQGVIDPDDLLDVVPGLAVLLEDKDAAGPAVGELGLLGVEIFQGADSPGLGVEGHQIHGVEVGADGFHRGAHRLPVLLPHQAAGPAPILRGGHRSHPGADHRPVDLVPGLDIR